MVFIIVTLVLFASIAFFNAVQGAFSAIIMFVLTTLSAGVAINFYQPLSQAWLFPYIGDYADPCALSLIFFATLIVLRTISDNLIRGNVVLSAWPDRIVSTIVSIPTALIIVGLASIAVQMLPFDEQVLLFNRFTYTPEQPGKLIRRGIFPYADDFTASFLAKLCNASLQKSNKLSMVHPDWPGEVSAQRIAIQPESKHAVLPGTVRVRSAWRYTGPLLIKKYPEPERGWRWRRRRVIKVVDKYRPADGNYFLGLTLALSPKAADPDGYHRFAWGQIRLVGFRGINRTKPINYYVIGIRDQIIPAEFNYARIKVPLPLPEDDDEAPIKYRNFGYISLNRVNTDDEVVDVIFEVPEDFVPWFVEYKRWARALVPEISQNVPKGLAGKYVEPNELRPGQTIRKGWRAELRVNPENTKFLDSLPDYLASQPQSADFYIPIDKQLLVVECEADNVRASLLRRIFGSVQRIVQKMVIDDKGKKYFPVGQYIIVKNPSGGIEDVEFAYDPAYVEAGKVPPLRKFTPGQLTGRDVRVGFLFFIPSGVHIERFEIGGMPIEAQAINLTAP